MLAVFWICNRLKGALWMLFGDSFSQGSIVKCTCWRVNWLAFLWIQGRRAAMSCFSDFGVWVVLLIFAGTLCTLLVLASILSWTCLPPFRRLIASLCPKYNDLPISKFLFQYNFACGDEFVEGNLIFCCTG